MNKTNKNFQKFLKGHQPRLFGLVVFYLALSLSSFAGNGIKKHKLKEVQGVYIGGKNMSPEDVENKALEEAKKNALSQAGIQENIASFQNLLKVESSGKYEEMFTSDILADMQGTVTEIEILGKPIRELSPDGGMKVTLTMNCTVIEYENKRDPEFDAWIEGINPVYANNAGMKFSFKPTKDAYLRIFFVSEKSESNLLFPSEYEKDRLFKANEKVAFPDPVQFVEYPVSTELSQETWKVIFVLLKQNIPFTEQGKVSTVKDKDGNQQLAIVNYKSIFKWISGISADQRAIKTFPITIHK